MSERTPPVGIAATDPAQLPLGDFEDATLVAPGGGGQPEHEGDDAPAAIREPPVCGEWSYDATDEADSRSSAFIVAHPIVAPAPSAPAPRRSTPIPRPQAPPPPALVRSLRTPMFNRALTPPTPLPALDELRSIHAAQPSSATTAIDLANALDKRGNIEGALTVLQRAIDAGADGVPLRCARAKLLSGRLRYDDAEAELKRAAKLRPDDPEVLLQQGILACRRAKWRDAVEPLEKVAKLDPPSAQAHFYLGEALNKLDRLDDALRAYTRAAELEPAHYRALKGVGIVLDRMGRPVEAAAFYRRSRDVQGS